MHAEGRMTLHRAGKEGKQAWGGPWVADLSLEQIRFKEKSRRILKAEIESHETVSLFPELQATQCFWGQVCICRRNERCYHRGQTCGLCVSN